MKIAKREKRILHEIYLHEKNGSAWEIHFCPDVTDKLIQKGLAEKNGNLIFITNLGVEFLNNGSLSIIEKIMAVFNRPYVAKL
jgi:hypothetical protein